MTTQIEFVSENGNDVTSMTKIQYIKKIFLTEMVIHTDKYEKIVFMENQLKSQKKKIE